jgi:hypothetical protein
MILYLLFDHHYNLYKYKLGILRIYFYNLIIINLINLKFNHHKYKLGIYKESSGNI